MGIAHLAVRCVFLEGAIISLMSLKNLPCGRHLGMRNQVRPVTRGHVVSLLLVLGLSGTVGRKYRDIGV